LHHVSSVTFALALNTWLEYNGFVPLASSAEGLLLLIGAHVSVSGGLSKGLEYALSVGAECMQFFAKSPRQWRGATLDPEKVESFRVDRETAGFGPVFTHTAYLVNLSTADEELRNKSVSALADELTRCATLGAAGAVTHLGNDALGDEVAAARRAGEAIQHAYELAGDGALGARLLLENTAGAGSTFGGTFDQLAATIQAAAMPSAQLGVCLDTCHGFAYGMPLDSAEGWESVVAQIECTLGLERLGLIHANDCMFERGSRRDRHAWIGDGFIGESGFAAMVCNPRLAHVPIVTEMPGDVPFKDIVNLEHLKRMRDLCAPSHSHSI
jgi:deoxyribonuclease-4